MLGLGRIIGDTAIIVVLLGATQNFAPVEGAAFPLNYLRGAGTTLTNFVYEASPTGNLNQPAESLRGGFRPAADGPGPERGRRRRPPPRPKGWNVEFLNSPPPPIRRLRARGPAAAATQVAARRPPTATATRPATPGGFTGARRSIGAPQFSIRRMEIDDVSVSYGDRRGGQRRLAAGPPGRGAVADRPLRLRQDDAAALAQPAHRADQHGEADAAASCSTTSTSR